GCKSGSCAAAKDRFQLSFFDQMLLLPMLLRPDVIILNSGFWRRLGDEPTQRRVISIQRYWQSALNATVFWRSTTVDLKDMVDLFGTKTSDVRGLERDLTQRMKANNFPVFDAFNLTKDLPRLQQKIGFVYSDAFHIGLHFYRSSYAELNKAQLQLLN